MEKSRHQDDLFVSIDEPLALRKQVLESSKTFIQIMHKYDDLMKIRKEKLKKISKLKENISGLKNMLNKVKRRLPDTPGNKINTKKSRSHSKNYSSNKNSNDLSHEDDDEDKVEKIEKELSDIESELNEINDLIT